MSELLLTETGVEHLPDGSTAVNVGPIVRALKFLTEGRGDDRGTDEAGHPLPDLMSLAFSVVEAIILGGRKAEYFRQVMRDLEAQDASGRSTLALAKEARRVQRSAPTSALDHAAESLEDLLVELKQGSLPGSVAHEAAQALEAFRAFGADRWLSASAQLLVALSALSAARPSADVAPVIAPARAPAAKRRAKRKAAKPPVEKASPKQRASRKAAKKTPAKKAPPKSGAAAKRRKRR